MELIDTHIHLTDTRYQSQLPQVISDSRRQGVIKLITFGTDLNDSKKNKDIADQYDQVFFGVGVHPHDAETYDPQQMNVFKQLLGHEKCVAVGEIGLDFYYEYSAKDIQISVFRQFLALAIELEMPATIHIREAEKKAIEIISEYSDLRFVCHSFTGSLHGLDQILSFGGYVSINGMVTFKKAENIRDIVKRVPMERLLLETDGPYLSPVPFRGEINKPEYLKEILKTIAHIKELNEQQCWEVTTQNAQKLFWNMH